MWKFLLATITLILFTTSDLLAGPAIDGPITVRQPDGTSFKATKHGDEFQNWMETESGHTVIRNKKTREWEYAAHDTDGSLRGSGVKVHPKRGAPKSTPKHLKPPRDTVREKNSSKAIQHIFLERSSPASLDTSGETQRSVSYAPGDWTPLPVSGRRKIIVICVNFTDRKLITSPLGWSSSVFSTAAGAKSVANFYRDNSFGTLFVDPVSHTQQVGAPGVVTVSVPYAHPDNGTEEDVWVAAAINAAGPFVDFASLDTNGNAYIDRTEAIIYLIAAGYEESGTSQAPSVWGHATSYSGGGLFAAGKYFPVYALSGELSDIGAQHPIGIVAHELGHQLCGLPDLYDTSEYNAGLGFFSLMASGSWGMDIGESAGTTPTNLDAWSREYLGWTSPVAPTLPTSLSLDQPLSSRTSAFKLILPSTSTSEYFLVENRQPVGWDRGLRGRSGFGNGWSGGLLLTHIDLTVGTVGNNDINRYEPNSERQGVIPVQATSQICNMLDNSGCRGDASILFYSGNNSLWGPSTTPNSNYYNGTPTNLTLSSISAPATTMTAQISLTSATSDDVYEENDDRWSAPDVTVPFSDNTLRCNDDDYFKVWVQQGESLHASISLTNANGDLDLYLYDSEGYTLVGSALTANEENVSFGPASTDDYYYVKVSGYNGSRNSYALTIETYTTDAPDLRTKKHRAMSSEVNEGDASSFSAYIYNSGLTAAAASHATLHLSTNSDHSTYGDHFIAEVPVIALSPLTGSWVTWEFDMPDLAFGPYPVWAKVVVDSRGEVSEGVEDFGPFVTYGTHDFTAYNDTTPEPFTFSQRSGLARSTEVTSDSVTITGINAAAPVSITGGSYSINGNAFTSTAQAVNNNDSVRVRLTSAATYSTTTNAILTVGGVSGAFTVTTMAATTSDQLPLTLTIGGTGGGTVSGSITCVSGGNCPPVNFSAGQVVNLLASPNAASTFGGWSGSCTHSGRNCSFAITRAATVTAIFTAAPKAMVGLKGFSSLQSAYSDSGTLNNAVIRLLEGSVSEDFLANRNIMLTVNGGYDAGYSLSSASTRIRGTWRLRAGTTRVKGVSVASPL